MNTKYANTGMVFVRIVDGKIMGPSIQLGTTESGAPDSFDNYEEIELTDEIRVILGDDY